MERLHQVLALDLLSNGRGQGHMTDFF